MVIQLKRDMSQARELVKKEDDIDLLLLLDCTTSMHSWIKKSQENLITIINKIK